MTQNSQVAMPNEIVFLSEQRKYDSEMEIFYFATKWECRGHKIDVNIDEYGYHVRIDKGTCIPNLCQEQLIAVMCLFLEKTKDDLRIQV